MVSNEKRRKADTPYIDRCYRQEAEYTNTALHMHLSSRSNISFFYMFIFTSIENSISVIGVVKTNFTSDTPITEEPLTPHIHTLVLRFHSPKALWIIRLGLGLGCRFNYNHLMSFNNLRCT